MNLTQEQPTAIDQIMIAITKKRSKKLVSTLEGVTGEYTIDGIAVITEEDSFIIPLTEDSYPFGTGSQDMEENDNTTSCTDLDGEERTDFLIGWLQLTDGMACVEAKKQGGWLPAAGEVNIIRRNLEAINEQLTAVGGTPISGQYWTSQLYSALYPWHFDTEKGLRMWRGMTSQLSVRAIMPVDGYSE